MKKLNPRPVDVSLFSSTLEQRGQSRHARQTLAQRHRILAAGVALLACSACASDDANDSGSYYDPSLGLSPAGDPDAEPRPSNTGDQYLAPGTNPFVMTAHDPLSTFASDVDTASYDLFVRDVRQSRLPQPASVRLEEYVNYFRYAYPAAPPDADVPFSISLAAAPSPFGAETTLLRVGIAGKRAPDLQGKPANLVFLVDVSGSMQGADRLPLVGQVLRQTLDLLAPSDTVSIVTYAGSTSVRLGPTPVMDRARIIAEIGALSAGGSTAGASGIDLAYAEASAGFIQGGLNHVILCTDGDFNVGRSTNDELLELIVEKRRTGITLTALGFGTGNLNDSMLELVSNAGNGFYGVISSESQAAEYVNERLLSTLSMIARDVKIQVEFNPEQVAAYRLLGYENRAIADQDFRNDRVDAGEIGAGHQVTALYELVTPGGALPTAAGAPAVTDGVAYGGPVEIAETDLVRVKLRYKHVDAGAADAALEVSASLSPSDIAQSFGSADADLSWAISVAAFSEILKHSPYAKPEQLDAIDASLAAQAGRDDERAELYELFQAARGWL